MIPGITYLPVASITRALADALRFLPTPAILPLRIEHVGILQRAARYGQDQWRCGSTSRQTCHPVFAGRMPD